jgi:chromosome segregation protein
VNLLQEFGRTSQFVVITHNKKTVAGASTLLGVTMEESGITKVIAVRLERSDGKAIRMEEPMVPLDEEEVEYEDGTELPPEPGAQKAEAVKEGSASMSEGTATAGVPVDQPGEAAVPAGVPETAEAEKAGG